MITNEFEAGETVTTVLDEAGEYDDVEVIITDDYVVISQNDEHLGESSIYMSHIQFYELLTAIDLPEGAFIVESPKGW